MGYYNTNNENQIIGFSDIITKYIGVDHVNTVYVRKND